MKRVLLPFMFGLVVCIFACSDWPNGKDVYAASATVSRIVADVYVDGASLAEGLLSLGLAHPYDGGRKVGW